MDKIEKKHRVSPLKFCCSYEIKVTIPSRVGKIDTCFMQKTIQFNSIQFDSRRMMNAPLGRLRLVLAT